MGGHLLPTEPPSASENLLASENFRRQLRGTRRSIQSRISSNRGSIYDHHLWVSFMPVRNHLVAVCHQRSKREDKKSLEV